MAKLFPELVFTRGPQKGRRVPLSKTMNVLGRDATCDIEVQDEYASRQHVRIIVEGSRIRLVNTSPNGTKVNGKLTEQAALADGDLIGVGLECEVRLEVAEPAGPPAPTGVLPGRAPVAERPVGTPSPALPGAAAPSDRRAGKKFKKPTMVVWVAVYLLVLGGVFGLLKLITGGGPITSVRGTEPLGDEQIRVFIDQPLTEVKNPGLAETRRAEAISMYEAWKAGATPPDHLFWTVKKFKESLAYQQAEDFGMATHRTESGEVMLVQDMFQAPPPSAARPDPPPGVKDALYDEVRVTYKNAYRDQRAGRLGRAADGYRMLQQVVPDAHDPIYKSATEQLNIVNAALIQQNARSGARRW